MVINDMRREFEVSTRTLGRDHPVTLRLAKELASEYHRAGDLVAALKLHEGILDGLVRLVGVDDHITVANLADLAHVWFDGWLAEGRADMAIPLFELAVWEMLRVCGTDHVATLTASNDLAAVYLATGQMRRAHAMFQQTLVDCVRVLGEHHELAETVRGNMDSVAQLPGAANDGVSGEPAPTEQEVAAAIADVLQLESVVGGGRVSVAIPAIGETLRLPIWDIKRITKSFTPMGDPALELAMTDGREVRPLILLADNVVFAPEDPVVVLMAPVPVTISNAPPLISYVEMVADAERFAAAAPDPDRTGALSGTCLLVRCVIAGAVRFGMRPVRAVAWWQQGWAAPPRSPRTSMRRRPPCFGPAYRRTGSCRDLPGRHRSRGLGSAGGEPHFIVQVRFDMRSGDLTLDELRIADSGRGRGLFQRLQYNVEQLGRALDLARINFLATGIGAYAFAKTRFPMDRELYDKIFPSGER
jgi:hypothetical protein